MRSAVSYMLSETTREPTMSHPDYEQEAHHHGCLLILVRGIGAAKPRSLQRIFERIQRVNNVKVTDSAGGLRDIWVRYIREYPVENNDWGDFQTHRRLLGLVTVGKYETQVELNELCRIHESLKVKYTHTLYDSRCILFGPDDGAAREEQFTTPSNFKSRALFYEDTDACTDLETNLQEFIAALFWVLESKRLEKTREKIDKIALLYAPFEAKDFVGLDMESRNNKKRCMGRATKQLGDLTLQAGLVGESLNLFCAASETLRAINDSLWLGAAFEGLCAASAIILYPSRRQTKRKTSPPTDGAMVIQLDTNAVHTEQGSSSASSTSSISSSTSAGSASSGGGGTGSSSSSSEHHSIHNNRQNPSHPANTLTGEEIVARYRDAIINYSKYRHAGIVETEAALKAARICIEQNQKLDVAMFLQNVLYINLTMSEAERVRRFETLTALYQEIGYHRKAAFCQRLAAWRHVAATNPTPDWTQSYRLMLDSFPGHKLALEPIEVLRSNIGWPVLQIDLVQQLVGAARRLGHSALATRHMTFLLQTMWQHLGAAEQREMAVQLQNLSAQCEGSPVPLRLENGTMIPPANLTDLPLCTALSVRDLAPHLRPQKIATNKAESGPFLFTPIHFSSLDRGDKRAKNKIAFDWVQHDSGDVIVKLTNPLPFELQVADMRLLTTGVVFQSVPETIILQPNLPTAVTLHGTPLEAGELEIHGYSTHTLGVKSDCRLEHMFGRAFQPHYSVHVIPALPRLDVKTSIPQTASFGSQDVLTTASLTLYNGESAACTVTLTNTSQVPIEFLEPTLHSALDAALQARILQYSADDLQRLLPIAPGASAEFSLRIFAEADFLGPAAAATAAPTTHSGTDQPPSLSGNTLTVSLPSRVSSPTNTPRRNELNASFRSTNSGHSSLTATMSVGTTAGHVPRHLEAQLRFRYSGAEAFAAGFCRQCAVGFNLELLPSAQVTSWDVLPAEVASQFYLVLDVTNLTAQEMTLNYTPNKTILIEARESCRIPVPVERCNLDEALAAATARDEVPNSLMSGNETDLPERICSEHIADSVSLKWTLASINQEGIASLKGISLSPSMLDLVTVAPLQWEISINEQSVAPQSEVTCSAGQCITLRIGICNLSATALHQLTLSVQFYQDYQNGMHNYRLETRVIMSGANNITIPALQKDEKAFHECSVLFFTPGRFKADIQCRSSPQGFVDSLVAHSWRFIPPIEITVVE